MVADPKEKEAGLNRFVERIYPGRNAQIRAINPQELKATTLMHMPIEEVSAKVRTGGPVDDEPDYALDCWAGVVPVSLRIGGAIDDERLTPGIKPADNVTRFAEGGTFDQVLLALARGDG
jgi:hypothetical protein